MGKLRLELRNKPLVSGVRYQEIKTILLEGAKASPADNVFYDLDSNEVPSFIKKEFLFVAAQEGLSLEMKRQRGTSTFLLNFAAKPIKRMSSAEAKRLILEALSSAHKPLSKKELVEKTGISPASWNLRIKELLEAGAVARTGARRDSKYNVS